MELQEIRNGQGLFKCTPTEAQNIDILSSTERYKISGLSRYPCDNPPIKTKAFEQFSTAWLELLPDYVRFQIVQENPSSTYSVNISTGDNPSKNTVRLIPAYLEGDSRKDLLTPNIRIYPNPETQGSDTRILALGIHDSTLEKYRNVDERDNIRSPVIISLYSLLAPRNNLTEPVLTSQGIYIIPEVHQIDDIVQAFHQAKDFMVNTPPKLTRKLDCTLKELDHEVRIAANSAKNPLWRSQNTTYFNERMEMISEYIKSQ